MSLSVHVQQSLTEVLTGKYEILHCILPALYFLDFFYSNDFIFIGVRPSYLKYGNNPKSIICSKIIGKQQYLCLSSTNILSDLYSVFLFKSCWLSSLSLCTFEFVHLFDILYFVFFSHLPNWVTPMWLHPL